MLEKTNDRGQAVIWIVLTAIIALGLFLILKNGKLRPISPSPRVPILTLTPTITPTDTPIITPASDAQIDLQLKLINDQSKSVDQSLNDTPIDVMN